MESTLSAFSEELARARLRVDESFTRQMPRLAWHPELQELAAHVLVGAGKALRPALVHWAYRQLNPAPAPRYLNDWALALEFVHTYSLVHDDLPAMDNDDFRRGKPTLHKLRNEAAAILAGDALLTGAFELLSASEAPASALAQAVSELARASGGAGMVGGQMRDMFEHDPELAALERTHREKTGALFGAALALGVLAAGVESPAVLASARRWGVELGLYFQIVDDILDATASSAELGKTAGKDAASGKRNTVGLLSLAGAQARAAKLREELATGIREWAPRGDAHEILRFVAERRS